MKTLIFDSGALISIAMAGLIPELKDLKKIFKGKFIITKEVKSEIIDRPLTIKRFELEAMMLQELIHSGILKMPFVLNISDDEIKKKTEELMNVSNNTFFGKERSIHLIDLGESSCLALSKILTEKKIENLVIVDERTTRLLGEKPENLKKYMESKMHFSLSENKSNYKFFQGFKFIRSTELMYVAYKKGIIKIKNKNLLDALLYALKFKGTAISDDEIAEIKRIC